MRSTNDTGRRRLNWEEQKEFITNLYIKHDKSCKEVLAALHARDFQAT
jgi:hypothetical protein